MTPIIPVLGDRNQACLIKALISHRAPGPLLFFFSSLFFPLSSPRLFSLDFICYSEWKHLRNPTRLTKEKGLFSDYSVFIDVP